MTVDNYVYVKGVLWGCKEDVIRFCDDISGSVFCNSIWSSLILEDLSGNDALYPVQFSCSINHSVKSNFLETSDDISIKSIVREYNLSFEMYSDGSSFMFQEYALIEPGKEIHIECKSFVELWIGLYDDVNEWLEDVNMHNWLTNELLSSGDYLRDMIDNNHKPEELKRAYELNDTRTLVKLYKVSLKNIFNKVLSSGESFMRLGGYSNSIYKKFNEVFVYA